MRMLHASSALMLTEPREFATLSASSLLTKNTQGAFSLLLTVSLRPGRLCRLSYVQRFLTHLVGQLLKRRVALSG